MKIDVVITWVDGNDSRHREKRLKYADPSQICAEDKAGDTRFSSVGEIFWCVASLNRFAPWVNRIYVVTDGQDPGLEPFLRDNFPDGYIPIEIVDHKVIFRGYEQYLPTFNSISLETMTWRIPGLSDCFIEFNDDLVLMNPVTPEDFFSPSGKVICYGRWSSYWFDRFTRIFKGKISGHKVVTTKESHMNGALNAGHTFLYIRPAHCQKALRRDFYEKFFSDHEDLLIKNISYRFRDAEQFTSQVLQYMSLHNEGVCEIRKPDGAVFFFQPKDKSGYFQKKMQKLKDFNGKFACFNSMDRASQDEQRCLVKILGDRLNVKF